MNPETVASSLHENERRILLTLRDKDSATTAELSQETGLSRDAVEKACSWAETKGVLAVEQETFQSFILTEEGQRYVADGLPEKRLIRLVGEGQREINGLKESFNPLEIALVWARRNDWASIKGGVLELTPKGLEAIRSSTLDEKILHELFKGPMELNQLDESSALRIMDYLSPRGLVSKSEIIEKRVVLTEFGRQVIPYLEEIAHTGVITQLTPEHMQSRTWRGAVFQRYDVSLPVPRINPGKRHFISQVIDYIRRFWVELGFREMRGNYLELSFWNFDALYQPQDHPARDLADTFYMKTPGNGRLPDPEMVRRVKETHEYGWTTGSTGWQYRWNPEMARKNCLRTHTTSLSVNAIARLRESDLPAKFFSVGRVFRNETIDWNHLAEFYQTDGIVVGDGVTFRNMQGYLKAYLEGLGLRRFRFRPSYFPYTEMSMEAEVWIEEKEAWMELFGAGMFRPEVVKPLFGRDVPVLAWGPGFDRLVMQSYRVKTIRELYGNDIGLLRKAKLWTE